LAVADSAGPTWSACAREAARALQGTREDESSLSIQLLADIRALLEGKYDCPVVSSTDLVRQLVALDAQPWATYSKNDRPLTPHGLARLLKPFGIEPAGTVRVGEKTLKGYRRDAFAEAFQHYLPPPRDLKPSQGNKPNKSGPELAISIRHNENVCDGSQKVTN